jgi:hypothetical protein
MLLILKLIHLYGSVESIGRVFTSHQISFLYYAWSWKQAQALD